MVFRDQNDVELFIGDLVEKDGQRFVIHGIVTYTCATVAVVENLVTKNIETLYLRDILKIGA